MPNILINLIILSVLFSFIVSQLIKFTILKLKNKKHAYESLYREYGGMPSTHTAVVSALVFSTYLLEGTSNLFFVSLIFAIIIVIDVVDSSWFYGTRDSILNKLIKKHNLTNMEKLNHLQGNFGHTILEVIVGIIIALIVTILIYFVIF